VDISIYTLFVLWSCWNLIPFGCPQQISFHALHLNPICTLVPPDTHLPYCYGHIFPRCSNLRTSDRPCWVLQDHAMGGKYIPSLIRLYVSSRSSRRFSEFGAWLRWECSTVPQNVGQTSFSFWFRRTLVDTLPGTGAIYFFQIHRIPT